MKELHNHIFSNTTCISKEIMLRYINQQLSQQELYEVEKHMLDCELCSDALAGMQYTQNSSILFAIDNEIDQRVRNNKAKAPIMRNLMVAASFLVIVFGTYFTVDYFNQTVEKESGFAINTPKRLEESNLMVDESKSEEGVVGNAPMKGEELSKELENNNQYPTEETNPVQVVGDEVALSDIPNDNIEMEDAEEDEVTERLNWVTITNEKVAKAESKKQLEVSGVASTFGNTQNSRREDNNKSPETLKNKDVALESVSDNVGDYKTEETKTRAKSNELAKRKFKNSVNAPVPAMEQEELATDFDDRQQSNTGTINGHKVVDYTAEYQKQYELKETIKTESTSAYFATKEDKALAEKEREELTIEITYKATLEKAIALYKSQKYTQAIEQFNIILAEHPDEVNGWFYGGLSNYHLKRYDKASKDLDKVLVNSKTDFNQEAKWYKALTLIELKQTEDAKKILKEIVAENGFYKTKAEEELKVLK